MSTDLTVANHNAVTLFAGATPADVVAGASEAAGALADIIEQRKLFQRISGRKHILVEGWQTLGTLVGVFAVKDGGVRELPWPVLAALGEEPEDPRTAAHGAWGLHRTLLAQRDLGRAYGYAAAYRAVKSGQEVGWGEGRCCRGEKTWMTREDYALASMAQTRGQSRTLKQPLGFIVNLAGYESTPAEELSDTVETPVATAVATPYGAIVDAAGDAKAAGIIGWLFGPLIDGAALVQICNKRFGTDHLPDAAAKMIDALKWAYDEDVLGEKAPEGAPANGAPPDEQPEV